MLILYYTEVEQYLIQPVLIAVKNILHPSYERVSIPYGASMKVRYFDDVERNTSPFWHYHPEMELVYVNGGRGKRHIGSHLSYFHDGELVLIGANLPHQGFTQRLANYKSETVVQMVPDFLGSTFFDIPEMKGIKHLLERSKAGLSFHGESKNRIGRKIEELPFIDSFSQILAILGILKDLSETHEYQKLNAKGFSLEIAAQDNDRINIVLNHIRENFQKQITLGDITDLISMTEPSFCRYFKKLTGKTFTQFLNEYRLVHASKLLAEKKSSITEVCFESGFTNYSHFNKQFLKFTGKSPSKYRSEVKQII